MYDSQRIKSGREVVEHDTGTFWKLLQLPDRRRLDDIEGSEKYKAREKSFPSERDGDDCNQLSCNFIDDYEFRVF